MTVTVEDLARHLGFAGVPTDTETLDRALGAARGVITPHLVDVAPVPGSDQEHVLDLATLAAAGTFWRAKDANGSFVFAEGTDQVAVLPRNVLATVWPMLIEAELVEAGFA